MSDRSNDLQLAEGVDLVDFVDEVLLAEDDGHVAVVDADSADCPDL